MIINTKLLSAGNFFGIGSILVFVVVLAWAGNAIIAGNSSN